MGGLLAQILSMVPSSGESAAAAGVGDVAADYGNESVQLPEEGNRFVPDARSSDETIYDKGKNSLVFHWSLLAGSNQLDASCESSQVPVEQHADKRDVAVDESFLGESFTNIPSASASIHHEEGYGQENSDQRNVSVESTLDTFLSWRLELVNARVRFRLYAGCDFPEYVASEESTSPSSCAPHSSLRNRDWSFTLKACTCDTAVTNMQLRYRRRYHSRPRLSNLRTMSPTLFTGALSRRMCRIWNVAPMNEMHLLSRSTLRHAATAKIEKLFL